MLAAQLICASCAVRTDCIDDARRNPPFAGVWGGLIFVNGQEQATKRGRGRPRKSETLDNARVRKALEQSANMEDLEQGNGPGQGIVKQIA